jgi:hypothetical protein
MQNINRISRAMLLSCAAIGFVVSVSPCFAADLGVGAAPPEIMPFKCDSLDPQVCFDIYYRLHNEPAPPSLDRRFLPQPPARDFAPNWSTKFEHYGLGTPDAFGTAPSGAERRCLRTSQFTGCFDGNNYLFR